MEPIRDPLFPADDDQFELELCEESALQHYLARSMVDRHFHSRISLRVNQYLLSDPDYELGKAQAQRLLDGLGAISHPKDFGVRTIEPPIASSTINLTFPELPPHTDAVSRDEVNWVTQVHTYAKELYQALQEDEPEQIATAALQFIQVANQRNEISHFSLPHDHSELDGLCERLERNNLFDETESLMIRLSFTVHQDLCPAFEDTMKRSQLSGPEMEPIFLGMFDAVQEARMSVPCHQAFFW